MSLVKCRDEMMNDFMHGHKPYGVLEDYRQYRGSESWRVSETVEELCEYILYLEDKLLATEG